MIQPVNKAALGTAGNCRKLQQRAEGIGEGSKPNVVRCAAKHQVPASCQWKAACSVMECPRGQRGVGEKDGFLIASRRHARA
jgi:hypothetical protein